jgi:hypothetical protein
MNLQVEAGKLFRLFFLENSLDPYVSSRSTVTTPEACIALEVEAGRARGSYAPSRGAVSPGPPVHPGCKAPTPLPHASAGRPAPPARPRRRAGRGAARRLVDGGVRLPERAAFARLEAPSSKCRCASHAAGTPGIAGSW